jgi:D-alanine-D-alanine ligase
VKGRELAISVLAGEALPVVEAIPRDGDFFNFEARYEIGRTDYVCPADLPGEETGRVQELAVRTYETLGCSGFARVDVMLADGDPEVLEVNAIPGLTDTSLFPMAAEAAGIDFTQLVERLLDSARERPESEATLRA